MTCISRWYKVLQSLNEINAPLQKLLSGNKQQKLSRKKGHNSAKIWLMITNIELDLYFIVIIIKFCKIWMKSIHPFKSYWTETKSVTTTPPPPNMTTTRRTDGQHDPYVSAMLRRWHNKNNKVIFITLFIQWYFNYGVSKWWRIGFEKYVNYGFFATEYGKWWIFGLVSILRQTYVVKTLLEVTI